MPQSTPTQHNNKKQNKMKTPELSYLAGVWEEV
jgi:hypothetical protein